jgi:hypothetical protein
MYFYIFILEFCLLFLSSKFVIKYLSILLLKLTKNSNLTILILSLIFFPGTLIHELSHLFMAGLLFVRTGQMSLFPKVSDDQIRMGSVEVEEVDIFRRAIIGVAPVIFGFGLIFALLYYFQQGASSLLMQVFIFYLIFAIGNTLYSSRIDLEGTVELLIAIIFVSGAIFVVKPEAIQILLQVLQKKEIVYFFNNADYFLITPLSINLITILLLKPLVKRIR